MDCLGYVAGLLVTFALIPQIVRVHRLKSAREISWLYNSMLLLGLVLWLVYGSMLELVPVILWNAIGIVVAGLLLLAKYKYGR